METIFQFFAEFFASVWGALLTAFGQPFSEQPLFWLLVWSLCIGLGALIGREVTASSVRR